jgi:hypothetical protein
MVNEQIEAMPESELINEKVFSCEDDEFDYSYHSDVKFATTGRASKDRAKYRRHGKKHRK